MGFGSDDLSAAFACFRASAVAIVGDLGPLRPARPVDEDLIAACAEALLLPARISDEEARAFFAAFFQPAPVHGTGGAAAFVTGYYEPVVDGAMAPSPAFTAPLLARPADLRTLAADEPRPAWARDLAAVRVRDDGLWEPYPARSAIEAAAESGAYQPVVWLRDWVEAFLIHVQGSARVRLADGRILRVTYAGRNGQPYTSIGRILVERGDIPAEAMSLERLKAWLRAEGQETGDGGRALMARNDSFIFFDAQPVVDDAGPTGGAGLPLTPLRSIAIDRTVWSYGLPFWVEATIPWDGPTPTPFRRLMVAQDTGSAIVGQARVDLFFGSGDAAGERAGDIRHAGRLTVLRPKPIGTRR